MTKRSNGLHITLARKSGIAAARPERHTSVRAAAEALSRRNADGASCELMSEALLRLVDLAFEEDSGGLCNADYVTGRLLIPLPWGRHGHQRWGLRPQEANILRALLFEWAAAPRGMPPLLIYDRKRRAWHVNLADYPDRQAATQWLARHPIGVAIYRAARDKVLGNA
jgi:hypothetical protein